MTEIIGDIVKPSVLVLHSGSAVQPSTMEENTLFVSGSQLSFISGSALWGFEAVEL